MDFQEILLSRSANLHDFTFRREAKKSHKIKIYYHPFDVIALPYTRLPARTRANEEPTMWSTLFTIVFAVSVVLSLAAVIMDSIKGGRLDRSLSD